MSQMTTAQARVQDPIITAVARGYRGQKAAIAELLFPLVAVAARAGQILSFGVDDFKLVNTVRAPGTNTRRVQLGYGSGKFSLVDHRLEATVPAELQEEAGAVPGLDLIAMSVRHVQNVMALERESIAASLARNAGNYSASNKETLSGTSQWSHASSDPFTDIMDGKEVIRSQIGIEPNSLAVAPKVLKGLRSHPKVLDRLSTASDRPPATIQQLKALFELENIVAGGAVHHDGTSFQDLWGKDAVLAYTTPASMEDMGSPNYGYTYQLRNYPEVEEGYFDPNTNSWYYPTKDAYQPVLVGASAGFLFKDAVA